MVAVVEEWVWGRGARCLRRVDKVGACLGLKRALGGRGVQLGSTTGVEVVCLGLEWAGEATAAATQGCTELYT